MIRMGVVCIDKTCFFRPGHIYIYIYIYIWNWLAMMNKKVARVLSCELGLPSYGELKLENWKKMKKMMV